jgi:mannose-6-phosphate isomerase-like protein (cupin superfamily)
MSGIMKRTLFVTAGFLLAGSVLLVAQAPQAPRGGRGPAADPTTAIHWSAKQLKELAEGAKGRVSPTTNMAGQSLIPSANMIYRVGDSGSEAHTKASDFIFVLEGGGDVVVGGTLVGGREERPDEIRGTSIEGGTRYAVAAGDSLYIPAAVPHQFFVEKGKHWVITIVKIPKP